MSLPEPLAQLFAWIEERGFYTDLPYGRLGYLHPEHAASPSFGDGGWPGGTFAQFSVSLGDEAELLPDHTEQELARLYAFALTGADGSAGAFWLDDDGRQRIVHLGSGSGSTMNRVLADDPVDFLRLLAVGHHELADAEGLAHAPSEDPRSVVHPNKPLREWVSTTFGVAIPARGIDIVPDTSPDDPFRRWIERGA